MSRVHRIRRRRASDSVAAHQRARGLAAERLDAPLEASDGVWLDEHLVGCDDCRSIAAAYAADRAALRGLRDHEPEPPRDLWARTSTAMEREVAASGGPARRTSTRRPGPRPALGVLSGVAVIAVVLGASVMSGGYLDGPATAIAPSASPPAVAIASSDATPGPTPIAVGAGSVGWVGTSANGSLAYNVAAVDEVCPQDRQPDCAPVADGNARRVELDIQPKSISRSPTGNGAVVVGTDAAGSDAILVIDLPAAEPTPPPAATPTPVETPTIEPTRTAGPSSTPTASDVQATPVTTPEPTPAVTPTATPTAIPTATPAVTPAPTVAATLAIVSGVKVVGQSAAYAPNGEWFAFTARPSDGSTGPDIYVWHVGDQKARPVTTDHSSVFASWVGRRVLGSRPTMPPADATAEVPAQSFFIDPATGEESTVASTAWRPIVDPAGRRAVLWDGTVRLAPDGVTSVPATGTLVLRDFRPDDGVDTTTAAVTVADGPLTEFDVRWDETGTWLAIWLADATDPAVGRLSLAHLDTTTGQLEQLKGAPHDVKALSGFSIANGRLAWATPPGQGGEGSRVQIVAWTDDAVGAIESGPVEGVVVVH